MFNSGRTKLFLDMEFTGLGPDAKPISIGIVSENGDEFYFEMNDYGEVSDWFKENVIVHLTSPNGMTGTRKECAEKLTTFFAQFPEGVEVWADVNQFDWVIFCWAFFGNAFNIPNNIHYIPLDIATLLVVKGVDPDINREKFAGVGSDDTSKHNALWDAIVSMACYYEALSL